MGIVLVFIPTLTGGETFAGITDALSGLLGACASL
jgi:hypothetical protein